MKKKREKKAKDEKLRERKEEKIENSRDVH